MLGRLFRGGGLLSSALLWSLLGVSVIAEGVAGEATASEPRWDQAALESVLAYARQQRSSAVVIVDHGEVIAERYWSVDADAGSPYTYFLWGQTEAGAPIEDVRGAMEAIPEVLRGACGGCNPSST